MELKLNPELGEAYKSPSQQTRVITETWAAGNLFCVACPSMSLAVEEQNTSVKDFTCPMCRSAYQLKATAGKFGRAVSNSSYAAKIEAIERGQVPHYAFLQYSKSQWLVTDLFVVPGHFITHSVIQERQALRESARRKGWVGSKILLREIPDDGRIKVVSGGMPERIEAVRSNWDRFKFLQSDRRALNGWGIDVLRCVRRLQSETGEWNFSLQDFYRRYEFLMSVWHPGNQNVRAKIRQQLQVLRDHEILVFRGPGQYQIIG